MNTDMGKDIEQEKTKQTEVGTGKRRTTETRRHGDRRGRSGNGVLEYRSVGGGKASGSGAHGVHALPCAASKRKSAEKITDYYAFFHGFPRFYAQIRAVVTRFYAFLRVAAFLSRISLMGTNFNQETIGGSSFEMKISDG